MNLREVMPDTQRFVPGFKFTTEGFAQREQFDAWCEFASSMGEIEAIETPKPGFVASADSYHLGSLQLTSFKLPPMRFKYTNDMIRKGSFDHWCISVVTRGELAAGGTVLTSYAAPFEGQVDLTTYSGLFFSRDEFWDVADELDSAAQRQVCGPMSYIVGDFLASLEHRAEKLTVSEAAAVNEAFGHLLRAMVRQTPTNMEAAKAPIAAAQFDRARRFINANLKSPHLTPEMICVGVGVSRRQLYYLFEQHGGVATFIRNRRLAACCRALTKISEKKLISQIAYDYGFTNLSSFYRRFAARYGFTPSEARSAWLSGHGASLPEGGTFVDWLLRVDEG